MAARTVCPAACARTTRLLRSMVAWATAGRAQRRDAAAHCRHLPASVRAAFQAKATAGGYAHSFTSVKAMITFGVGTG